MTSVILQKPELVQNPIQNNGDIASFMQQVTFFVNEAAAGKDARIKEQQDEIAVQQAKIQVLTSDNNRISEQCKNLQRELTELESKLAAAVSRRNEVGELRASNDELMKDNARLALEVKSAKQSTNCSELEHLRKQFAVANARSKEAQLALCAFMECRSGFEQACKSAEHAILAPVPYGLDEEIDLSHIINPPEPLTIGNIIIIGSSSASVPVDDDDDIDDKNQEEDDDSTSDESCQITSERDDVLANTIEQDMASAHDNWSLYFKLIESAPIEDEKMTAMKMYHKHSMKVATVHCKFKWSEEIATHDSSCEELSGVSTVCTCEPHFEYPNRSVLMALAQHHINPDEGTPSTNHVLVLPHENGLAKLVNMKDGTDGGIVGEVLRGKRRFVFDKDLLLAANQFVNSNGLPIANIDTEFGVANKQLKDEFKEILASISYKFDFGLMFKIEILPPFGPIIRDNLNEYTNRLFSEKYKNKNSLCDQKQTTQKPKNTSDLNSLLLQQCLLGSGMSESATPKQQKKKRRFSE